MIAAHLSPITRAGLRHVRETPAEHLPGARQKAQEITAYKCPVCGDLHLDEDEAEKCCQGKAQDGLHDQDADVSCPVCGMHHRDHYVAADCCLWHDLSAPARWRIAALVEAGEEWAEAIEGEAEC